MNGQQHDRRSQANTLGGAGQLTQQYIGAGIDAEQVEMVLADPHRVQTDLLGIKRLGVDILDELLGSARVVDVTVITESEIAKLHVVAPPLDHVAVLDEVRTETADDRDVGYLGN